MVQSYALDTVPQWYRPTNWPPIGPPAAINSRMTEVQSRAGNGLPTLCREARLNNLTGNPAPEATWGVYPNPAHGPVYLRNLLAEPLQLSVFAVDGRMLRNFSVPASGTISLALPAGIWFLRDGAGQSRKVWVQ